ncbi:hypothetical protein pb186bvf_005689 [Paramecium bursaria]
MNNMMKLLKTRWICILLFTNRQTIKFKLESNKYSNQSQVFDDLFLIYENCKYYNQSGSIISKQACYLEKLCNSLRITIDSEFQKRKKTITPQQNNQAFDYRLKKKPSDEQQKLKFCQAIKNLDNDKLMKIINYLAEHQPDALSNQDNHLIGIVVNKLIYDNIQQIYINIIQSEYLKLLTLSEYPLIVFKITKIFCINNSLFNHKAISRKINILKDLILNKSFMMQRD